MWIQRKSNVDMWIHFHHSETSVTSQWSQLNKKLTRAWLACCEVTPSLPGCLKQACLAHHKIWHMALIVLHFSRYLSPIAAGTHIAAGLEDPFQGMPRIPPTPSSASTLTYPSQVQCYSSPACISPKEPTINCASFCLIFLPLLLQSPWETTAGCLLAWMEIQI